MCIRDRHRWLLDSMKPDGGIFLGKMIVGTATLMFVFVLISGIVIWWPRTKKALKLSLIHIFLDGVNRVVINQIFQVSYLFVGSTFFTIFAFKDGVVIRCV